MAEAKLERTLTEEELEHKEWLRHPVTVRLLQALSSRREETKELWAAQMFGADTMNEAAMKNAFALGGVDTLAQVMRLISEGEV